MSEENYRVEPSKLFTHNGLPLSKSLFYEFCYEDPKHAIFTVKEEDHTSPAGILYKSLHKIYMELTEDDLTEYTFAKEVFGSWSFWLKLTKAKDFKPVLKQWREETAIRSKAASLKILSQQVKEKNYQAAKYLVEESKPPSDEGELHWHSSSTSSKTKAKPSPKRVSSKSLREGKNSSLVDSDAARILN